jgi:hypothetical protein
MYRQKVISKKTLKIKSFFVGTLKVNDENSRIRIQDPVPLVRGMDPRIGIRSRIHTKVSWIRNTGLDLRIGIRAKKFHGSATTLLLLLVCTALQADHEES